jgi:hypothetical protein
MAARLVEFSSRRPVVTEVGEPPCLPIKDIWPVGIGATCVQHDELRAPLPPAAIAKAAPIADRKEPSEWVVASVSGAAALVRRVNDEVGARELVECKHPPCPSAGNVPGR